MNKNWVHVISTTDKAPNQTYHCLVYLFIPLCEFHTQRRRTQTISRILLKKKDHIHRISTMVYDKKFAHSIAISKHAQLYIQIYQPHPRVPQIIQEFYDKHRHRKFRYNQCSFCAVLKDATTRCELHVFDRMQITPNL